MLSYLGSMSVAAALPFALPLGASVQAAFGPIVAELSAKLGGLTALSGTLTVTPPSIAASLQVAAGITAALQASIGPPSINFSFDATLGLIKALKLQLELIQVALDAAIALGGFEAAAGVHMFIYDGALDGLPAALGAAPGLIGAAPSTAVYAPILLAEASNAATVATMQVALRSS